MYPTAVQENLDKAIAFFEKRIAEMPAPPEAEQLAIRRRVTGNTAKLKELGPVNIVILGDSVSHGCFGGYGIGNDYHAVYHNRLRLYIQRAHQTTPVNILNMAVGGENASFGDSIFEERVAPYRPDLVIVCFGLNDVNSSLASYVTSLESIFNKCQTHGFDCVFLTPNMLNTHRAEGTVGMYWEYAHKTADMQNEGRMDEFMDAAKEVAVAHAVPVCDAYALWKEMQAEGIDITLLLTNLINHPLPEMHDLFARLLCKTILGEEPMGHIGRADDGMTAVAK
ncbi:MAG: hypothetical protein IJ009_04430 [Clostridia bacterium]|nr:hypothetical protein [Clostridia bacterium]